MQHRENRRDEARAAVTHPPGTGRPCQPCPAQEERYRPHKEPDTCQAEQYLEGRNSEGPELQVARTPLSVGQARGSVVARITSRSIHVVRHEMMVPEIAGPAPGQTSAIAHTVEAPPPEGPLMATINMFRGLLVAGAVLAAIIALAYQQWAAAGILLVGILAHAGLWVYLAKQRSTSGDQGSSAS